MDDSLRIHLLIDNKRYPLHIKRDEELFYRNAAKQIDNKLNKYRGAFPNFSNEHYWAMVALDLAYENQLLKDRNDTLPYQERIKRLLEDVEACIGQKGEMD